MKKLLYVLLACCLAAVGCQDDASEGRDGGFGLDSSWEDDAADDAADDSGPGDDGGGDASSSDWASCAQPGDCTLEFNTCCGVCEVPTLDDYDAINADMRHLHRQEVCPEETPCPGCASQPAPWLVATCNESNTCQGVDIRQMDLTSCTTDDDCRLRTRSCCECGGDTSEFGLVAVSDHGAYTDLVCGQEFACPECVPQYPEEATAVCADDGHCEVEWGTAP